MNTCIHGMVPEWCGICAKMKEQTNIKPNFLALQIKKENGKHHKSFNLIKKETKHIHIKGHLSRETIDYLGKNYPNIEIIQITPSEKKFIGEDHVMLLEHYGIDLEYGNIR